MLSPSENLAVLMDEVKKTCLRLQAAVKFRPGSARELLLALASAEAKLVNMELVRAWGLSCCGGR